ncbi:MAG: galactokinase [Fimbriimonadaceae bacterium]|nr:galactokinase [Fimbriimonadaceae bacterium]
MAREAALDLFRSTFRREPTLLSRGPGRINLLGEHTDYSDGFVFPCAIDREVWVAAAPAEDSRLHLVSREKGPAPAVSLADLDPQTPPGNWTGYPAGVAWAMSARTGIQAAVAADLPDGAGVSSSAAIEMAFAQVWNRLEARGLSALDLAKAAQKAEREFVGVPCGIMDQAASALGVAGHALLLDTRSLEHEAVPLPPGLAVVLCDTGQKRGLVDGEYRRRAEAVAAAAAGLGLAKLRDANPGDEARLTDDLLRRRARHVLTENARCLSFVKALRARDDAEIGRLMAGSHASLRDDFDVSTPALDAMVLAAVSAPGCLGARLTGAGFGGAVVALVEEVRLSEFCDAAVAAFRRAVSDYQPTIIPCHAADGASIETI